MKLVGKYHCFDNDMYVKYDLPAREKIKSVLGDIVQENPNIYEQDFIINQELCKSKYKYLEVQVNALWTSVEYPDKCLTVYERKGKYDNQTLFITMNKLLTRGYIFDRSSFSDKPRRKQKYHREFVYEIPWNKCSLVYIDHLDKLSIELF